MKQRIIVIIGPTAVGKTKLSIELSKRFNGEVINGDSMQIYEGLDIGTAKVTDNEKESIIHHLLDTKTVEQPYSVSEFKKDASTIIDEISERGNVPIIVGGTGLYIESLLYNMSHGGKASPDQRFREKMERFAKEYGNDELWKRLELKDKEAASQIHPNNVRRVIRALEVEHVTGKTFTSFQNEKKDKEAIYDALVIGLNTDRELLYDRINDRVDKMMEMNLLDEVEKLYENVPYTAQSTKGIGYKEFFPYFQGEISLEQAIEQVKQNSRRYAKRQLTWFKNRLEVNEWFDLVQNPEEIKECNQIVEKFLQGK